MRWRLAKDYIDKLLKDYQKAYTYDWYKNQTGYDEYSLIDDIGYADKDLWSYDHPHMRSTYTEEERHRVQRKWTGALVRFAGHVRAGWLNPIGLNPISPVIPDLKITGTVISIDPSYRDTWMAQVLWSNGTCTSENADDLMIVAGL